MTRSINEDNAQEFKTEHWPTDIKYKSEERALHISFDNGENFVLPAEYLRVESPSAEVQGHHPSQKKVLSGRRMVGIMGIDPVGNYAVKITFDDLHDTGIFSWQYLYKLATERDVLWQKYLAELESRGLSRDP
ncbi:gamma-butyrobetaine hydroxylase-like domain-containing protein [Kiloniella sp.]|uniref:gamma-butyrobetaine hydroxylase-like domain-containing protein n=1 Tax=Kiloniella sp. TaxID=1938587 RepID=UPI003B028096